MLNNGKIIQDIAAMPRQITYLISDFFRACHPVIIFLESGLNAQFISILYKIGQHIFLQKMEDLHKNSRKNSDNKQNNNNTNDQKLGQLHHLIKGYLNNCNVKKIEKILPVIQKAKCSLEEKKKQIQKLEQFKISQKELASYYEQRNNLNEQLKKLAKSVEIAKLKTKTIKIKRKEISEELKKNEQACKQLQTKNNSFHINSSKQKLSFPRISRISGFNFELHHANPNKRLAVSQISSSNTGRSNEKPQEQSYYNSINFLRMKQIQRLLDQITTQSNIYRMQKKLMGDPRESVVKKVFKNFSIKEYFAECLNDKQIYQFLQGILAL